MNDSIQITWHINDVKSIRPDLTDEQCSQVLTFAKRHHDSTIGINWHVLESIAETLHGELDE